MIVNKQEQRVSVLELSTLPLIQDNVEHSPSGETPDTYQTHTNNSEHSPPNLLPVSSNYDEQARSARIEKIKNQLACKQYHVNPRSLAHAIYHHDTKRHR